MRTLLVSALVLATGCTASKTPPPRTAERRAAPRQAADRPARDRPAPPARVAPRRRVALTRPARPVRRTGRPWLGVWLGKDRRAGVLIRKVFPGSPAAKAKVKVGDRVLAADGATVSSIRQLQRRVARLRPGDKLMLAVMRGGKQLAVSVLLEPLPSYAQRVRKFLVGKPAPTFSVTRVGGSGSANITTAGMKGKLWLLEFWASWCGACRRAVPLLKKVYKAYSPFGLHIVAIAKDPVRRIAPLASALSLPYQVGADPYGKALSAFMVRPIPAFMLVDKRGIVIDVAVGRGWTVAFQRMLRTIRAKLTPSKTPARRARP